MNDFGESTSLRSSSVALSGPLDLKGGNPQARQDQTTNNNTTEANNPKRDQDPKREASDPKHNQNPKRQDNATHNTQPHEPITQNLGQAECE